MSKMLFDVPRPAEAPKDTTAEIAPKPYKHSIVDSSKTPIESLAAWIGGSNLQVDYYSQIFGGSEELKAFDPNQLNPYQNYHKINRLIIKLQGAFSQDDEGENGRFSISASAVIPPFPNLVPNVGDAIIADMGEGDAGQFSVTRVRKLTNNHASAWEITLKHDRVVTSDLEQKLNSKVTKESYYQRDYLITGQNAILAAEDYNAVGVLNQHLRNISQMFVSNNFSYANHTLIIPGQADATYDPYVVRATLKVVSGEDSPMTRDIREYNCDDHRIPKFVDIYTAVMKRDKTLLYNTFKEFACVTVALLNPSVYQNSVRYSGIRYIVAPYRPNLDNDNYATLNEIITGYRLSVVNPGITLTGTTGDDCRCVADIRIPCECCDNGCTDKDTDTVDTDSNFGNPGMDIPTIGNTSYVLSTAFYDKKLVECSLFERVIWNILDDKPMNYKEVFAFCENYHKWGKLEQYYLGPLLILMIRATLHGL